MPPKNNIIDPDYIKQYFSEFSQAKIEVCAGKTDIATSPFKSEVDLMKSAVIARKLDFYSGRYYARKALTLLGYPPNDILCGKKGNPIWPTGTIGSITHDQNYVITVAAKDNIGLIGIGIDLIITPENVGLELQHLIAQESELVTLLSMYPNTSPLALAFSLKESVVKAVSPNIDHYLNLLDIKIEGKNDKLIARIPHIGYSLDCSFIDNFREIITMAIMRANSFIKCNN